MKHGIKFGVIYGVISIAISLVIYLISKELVLKTGPMLVLAFVLGTALMVMAARAAKAENGGILPFGEALITVFTVFVVGSLITTIFSYVLMNFIDPSLQDLMRDQAVEMMEKMSNMMGGGANEAQLDEIREQLENQNMSSLPQMILGWLGNCIGGLIYSLIIAAIVKKNPQFT